MRRGWRWVIGAAIGFHLAVIALVPNDASYLNERLTPLLPYANVLGLHTTWNLFSPDPTPALFLGYTLRSDSDEELAGGSFPESEEPYSFREHYNRRIVLARVAALAPALVDTLHGPWLCRRYPDAASVEIELVSAAVPSLAEVQAGGRLTDVSRRRVEWERTIACSGQDPQ